MNSLLQTRPLFLPFALLLLASGVLGGCQKPNLAKSMRLTNQGALPLDAPGSTLNDPDTQKRDATFDSALKLVGVRAPDRLKAGEPAAITLFVEVQKNVFEPDLKVFVHGQVPGAELNQLGADHKPLGGAVAPAEWNVGDVVEDAFTLTIPPNFPGEVLEVFGGFYAGKRRFQVSPKGAHDGKHRVLLARIKVEGSLSKKPSAQIFRRQGKVLIDGKLDEADWGQAQVLGPFISYDGRSRIKNSTVARIFWDVDHLYVGFECKDADIHTPYTKRDDPLYNSEAVEIFIDADGDKDEYVELQAAPNGIRFDAAFKGGRRKNFETAYNVDYEVKNTLDGTFNDPSDRDRGWISEWKIPIAQLRDVPGPVAAGTQWQINLFRLDRIRRGNKVVGSEASAWSSPLSGDFHNLDRFGTVTFADAP
jgi:hypothetical protein